MQSNKKNTFESEMLKAFKEAFNKEIEVEEKIGKGLEFMKGLLADLSQGDFKDFWNVKKLVAPLFKEKMNPIKKNHLWNQYFELVNEARHLKEIKDEQAAFSIEQVELAIEALEVDIGHFDRLIETINPLKLSEAIQKLSLDKQKYLKTQRKIQLIKTLIARLDALRKETLLIDMRISHKNKILKRLSTLGDILFPKRKELIQTISESFIADVDTFVKDRFPEGKEGFDCPDYVVRNEIRSFQEFAKLLPLNSQSFTQTRKSLNECWGQLREREEKRREERAELSEEHKKNFESFLPKVAAFETFCLEKNNQKKSEILKQGRVIQDEMKDFPLDREHIKVLKDQIQKAQQGALDKIQEEIENTRRLAQQELSDFKEKLDHLIQSEHATSLEDLKKGELELKEVYETLKIPPMELHFLERKFAFLKSFIFDKQEATVHSAELERLYTERSAHYEVLKKEMEEYRKALATSNLDFESAMAYRELHDSAKMHLDSEMKALETLEEKLI